MGRRERTFADDIRWLARWGPYVVWGVAATVILMVWILINRGVGVAQAVAPLIGPVTTNVGCGFLIRWLRPRMLANADRWERIERDA